MEPDPTISLGREDGTVVVATLSGYLPLIDAVEALLEGAESGTVMDLRSLRDALAKVRGER